MDYKTMLGDAYTKGMSAEDILKALEGLEIQKPQVDTTEIDKLKKLVSDANSEASKYKKELNAKLSEDEKIKQKEAEEREKLQNDYNTLLKEVTVSKYNAKFLELGFESNLAQECANAMSDGDTEKVFENIGKYRVALEKQFKADSIKSTPKPNGGGSGATTITKEQFDKMSYKEKNQLFNDNPELYNELNK